MSSFSINTITSAEGLPFPISVGVILYKGRPVAYGMGAGTTTPETAIQGVSLFEELEELRLVSILEAIATTLEAGKTPPTVAEVVAYSLRHSTGEDVIVSPSANGVSFDYKWKASHKGLAFLSNAEMLLMFEDYDGGRKGFPSFLNQLAGRQAIYRG